MYRHHPKWAEVIRLVREGAIGDLLAVQSWFSYYNDDPHNIRNRPENGGGAVMDIGCYNINVSRMLFDDEPTSISATVRRDPTMGIDTLTSAVLEFPGGGQATFTCSIRAEDDQRVHIVGTSGRIDVEIPFNSPPDRQTRIFVTKGGDPPVDPAIETHVFAAANQYTIQAHLFAQAILDDTAAPVPISDAIANMRVIETVLDPVGAPQLTSRPVQAPVSSRAEAQTNPRTRKALAISEFFADVGRIAFEGPDARNELAYRVYEPDRMVLGKRMEDHLRIAVCYWHSFNWPSSDVFGAGTLDRP